MLKWAALLAFLAVLGAVLGLGGFAGAASGVLTLLAYVCAVGVLITLGLHFMRRV